MQFILNNIPVRAKTQIIHASASVSSSIRSLSNSSPSVTGKVEDDAIKNSGRNYCINSVENKLAKAAVKHVPRYGWTQDAVTAAAMEDPKLSISMAGMLTPMDLVSWLMDDMNHQLRRRKEENRFETNAKLDDNYVNNEEEMAQQQSTVRNDVDHVFDDIQWRLQQVIPLVESGQWHRGMAMGLSTPVRTQSQLHEFLEIIAPKNSSTAYHAALGAIFVSTELFFLTDKSLNYTETWSFLRNRLDELDRYQNDSRQPITLNDPLSFLLNNVPKSSDSVTITASMAVGQSLMEGAASLFLPESFRFMQQQHFHHGTNPRDYESTSSSSSSSS